MKQQEVEITSQYSARSIERGSDSPRPIGSATANSDRIGKSLSILESRLYELRDRLQPILHNNIKSSACEKDCEKRISEGCEFGERLYQQHVLIGMLTEATQEILDRLDI